MTQDRWEKFVKRFWSKVEKKSESECWLWKGSYDKSGYGRIWEHISGSAKYRTAIRRVWCAHRLSFFIENGFEPEMVCHSCDVRGCVNPCHLWAGNQKMNMQDMVSKGRSTWGTKNHSAKHSDDLYKKVKNLVEAGKRPSVIAREVSITVRAVERFKKSARWRYL